jgi:hypothetical protein
VIPACRDEAGGGPPAHGERLAAVEHPRPVDPVVELGRKVGNPGIVKVGTTTKDTAQQDGRIDGGDLTVNKRLSSLDVVEVIEKAVLIRHLVEVKLKRRQNLLSEEICCEIISTVGNAERGETKASGRYARNKAVIQFPRIGFVGGAVKHLSGRRISLFSEIEAGAVFHIFKKFDIEVAQQPR